MLWRSHAANANLTAGECSLSSNVFASTIQRHWCGSWCPDSIVAIAGDLSQQGFKVEAQRLNDLGFARAWIASVLSTAGQVEGS